MSTLIQVYRHVFRLMMHPEPPRMIFAAGNWGAGCQSDSLVPCSCHPCSLAGEDGLVTPCSFSLMPQSTSWRLALLLCKTHGGLAGIVPHGVPPQVSSSHGGGGLAGIVPPRMPPQVRSSHDASHRLPPRLQSACLGWGEMLVAVADAGMVCASVGQAATPWSTLFTPPPGQQLQQVSIGETGDCLCTVEQQIHVKGISSHTAAYLPNGISSCPRSSPRLRVMPSTQPL